MVKHKEEMAWVTECLKAIKQKFFKMKNNKETWQAKSMSVVNQDDMQEIFYTQFIKWAKRMEQTKGDKCGEKTHKEIRNVIEENKNP
jgi:hypothetical protein